MKARLLPLLLLLASGMAHADWFTGNLGLASDYQFRAETSRAVTYLKKLG